MSVLEPTSAFNFPDTEGITVKSEVAHDSEGNRKVEVIRELSASVGFFKTVTASKVVVLGFWGAVAFVILFLTPIGGIVKGIVGIGGLVGAGALLISAVYGLSDHHDFKTAGYKCLGAVVLVALALLAIVVLPSLPRTTGPDICWDGRSNAHC